MIIRTKNEKHTPYSISFPQIKAKWLIFLIFRTLFLSSYDKNKCLIKEYKQKMGNFPSNIVNIATERWALTFQIFLLFENRPFRFVTRRLWPLIAAERFDLFQPYFKTWKILRWSFNRVQVLLSRPRHSVKN